VLDKLNVYDMLGYLIPGGVLLLTGYLIGGLVLQGSVPAINDVSSFSESLGGIIILFALSYPLGHLVQSFGEWWEDLGNRRRKARPSELLLLEGKLEAYSPNVQRLIKQRGCLAFGLAEFAEPSAIEGDFVEYVARLKELFSLAWNFIMQKDFGVKAETYLAISALSRGLMVTSCLGAMLASLLVVKQILSSAWPRGFGPIHLQGFDENQLVVGVALLLMFLIAASVFGFHWNRFRLYFARSVWDGFMAASPLPERKKH